jgi:putative ABC transport system substrate-binding protein
LEYVAKAEGKALFKRNQCRWRAVNAMTNAAQIDMALRLRAAIACTHISAALRIALAAILMLGYTICHAGQNVPARNLSASGYVTPSPYSSGSNEGVHSTFMPLALLDTDEINRKLDAQGYANYRGAIAVVYPDLEEPYHSIFSKMIEGIEERAKGRVRTYPLSSNADVAESVALLKRSGTKVVIALGRQGLQVASGLDKDVPVVVGGVLSIPDMGGRNVTGVTLAPDPMLLFARLRSLLPNVRRVIVIYDPVRNDWLIKLARDAARAYGLELVAHEAHDIGSAARLYEAAFASADGRHDAVWLPQDATTVDEGTILPLVLREAWNRSIPVFSSSYLHVRKGALFALYPNNLDLGHTLGTDALNALAGEPLKRGMQPLHEVRTAINLRTASHIGLTISYQKQLNFDSVFPEP